MMKRLAIAMPDVPTVAIDAYVDAAMEDAE